MAAQKPTPTRPVFCCVRLAEADPVICQSYVRLVIERVEVGHKRARIVGSKTALARCLAATSRHPNECPALNGDGARRSPRRTGLGQISLLNRVLQGFSRLLRLIQACRVKNRHCFLVA